MHFNELAFKRDEIFMSYTKQVNVQIYQKNTWIFSYLTSLILQFYLQTSFLTPPHYLHVTWLKIWLLEWHQGQDGAQFLEIYMVTKCTEDCEKPVLFPQNQSWLEFINCINWNKIINTLILRNYKLWTVITQKNVFSNCWWLFFNSPDQCN